MSERKTPLCPMLLQGWYADMLGHWLRDVGAGAATMEQADNAKRKACSCEGSRCAWWVSFNVPDGDPMTEAVQYVPSGRGNCGRAINVPLWPDPATTEETQP